MRHFYLSDRVVMMTNGPRTPRVGTFSMSRSRGAVGGGEVMDAPGVLADAAGTAGRVPGGAGSWAGEEVRGRRARRGGGRVPRRAEFLRWRGASPRTSCCAAS